MCAYLTIFFAFYSFVQNINIFAVIPNLLYKLTIRSTPALELNTIYIPSFLLISDINLNFNPFQLTNHPNYWIHLSASMVLVANNIYISGLFKYIYVIILLLFLEWLSSTHKMISFLKETGEESSTRWT